MLYNLTADVDKRQKGQSSRVYFAQSGSQISQVGGQFSLYINREQCRRYTTYVKVRIALWASRPDCRPCVRALVRACACVCVAHVLR